MISKDVFKVRLIATWEGEAESVSDANEKADNYWASKLDEATHEVTQREIWVDEGG
ncbi:hypothetical protein LCGC14_0848650 [marine sediment metagenome]|uniref:Uncharacterized protein n=1 Tax=marine sediment metagenome TaxID=412755 RepID=A0A0F9PFS7_9ZZZZ